MKKRRRRGKADSFPVTLGVFVGATALAGLFLTVSGFALRTKEFYIGWCGHAWERYNGDGMIRPASAPVFYWANVGLYGFLGASCALIACIAGWQLLTRFRLAQATGHAPRP